MEAVRLSPTDLLLITPHKGVNIQSASSSLSAGVACLIIIYLFCVLCAQKMYST